MSVEVEYPPDPTDSEIWSYLNANHPSFSKFEPWASKIGNLIDLGELAPTTIIAMMIKERDGLSVEREKQFEYAVKNYPDQYDDIPKKSNAAKRAAIAKAGLKLGNGTPDGIIFQWLINLLDHSDFDVRIIFNNTNRLMHIEVVDKRKNNTSHVSIEYRILQDSDLQSSNVIHTALRQVVGNLGYNTEQ